MTKSSASTKKLPGKLFKRISSTLEGRLTVTFLLASTLIFLVNFFLFMNINSAIERINQVFYSNVQVSTLSESLDNVQQCLTNYLNTRSSQDLGSFYEAQSNYQDYLSVLDQFTGSPEIQSTAEDIRNLSDSYLEICENALTAKRGRNIQKYKAYYDSARQMCSIIQSYIYSMNKILLVGNSDNYMTLESSFRTLELISLFMIVVISIINTLIIVTTIRRATAPMHELAAEAGEIGQGNFDVPALEVRTNDEIGIVSSAFNEMVVSIRGYVQKLRESMETENRMKERELLMDSHLKEAELKYLQAQINPHFLFNTLNAGAQLAMLEDAESTYKYLQNVAAFFRNKTNREKQITTLADEITLVDNYIYIINVRFSGEINYEKNIDEDLVHVSIPSMILQPIVENAINHGIRGIDRPAMITLSVYRTGRYITISIRDNGVGMTQEQIEAILAGHPQVRGKGDETNGVGLANVVSRLRLFYGSEEGGAHTDETEDVFDITSAGPDQGTEVLLYVPVPQ